ncbi:MAG: hypothetical protein JST90_07295 [Bacteroidetes bacterium]|nr:hypothetical protein [Bacteroidota bacterium]
MMSGFLWDELTDSYSITVVEFPREKEYVAEVFIKDKDLIWYGVKRYGYLPTKSIIFRDTYAMHCKSPRPYKPGQICDGSITAPALHLFIQLCEAINADPVGIYAQAYEDSIFTNDQISEIKRFAEWQGVEIIYDWNPSVITAVLESLHEVNYHQLANTIEEYMCHLSTLTA